MVRLGDVVRIEASSKQVAGDRFWLLNLDSTVEIKPVRNGEVMN